MPVSVPFFMNRQLSIALAEPVVILRGNPRDPVTNVLRGEVELVLTKPTPVSTITIQFVGQSRMLWPEGSRHFIGIGSRGMKLMHEKKIYEQELVLMSAQDDQNKQVLGVGLHRWPFEFLLPNNLVDTIEDETAKTNYSLQVLAIRPNAHKLRCRRNVLVLRTMTSSDAALESHSLQSLSTTTTRHMDLCDVSLCIETSVASSGTPFPISLVINPNTKQVHLESFSVILTERRVYRLPEYDARRTEENDFKVKLGTASSMIDPSLALEAVSLDQLRRAVSTKNAHIEIGANSFQYRFMFTLPNCVDVNHSTDFYEILIRHRLRIQIELKNGDGDLRQVYLEVPITILDCRLKEDYSILPTYEEALLNPVYDEGEKPGGFFVCPCYLDYQKKRRVNAKQEWIAFRNSSQKHNHNHAHPPPPAYDEHTYD
ncbi:hypothetical protein CLU79DRAFT_811675 [Phycomyces nitens]|nr:hypothetical protein CLU79DRAFT_811675 [Phycomyces nitens]